MHLMALKMSVPMAVDHMEDAISLRWPRFNYWGGGGGDQQSVAGFMIKVM